MPVYDIEDEFQVYRLDGELIGGPVSTAFDHTGAQRPRWLEASLYARAAGGYVVAQVNLSLVWHLLTGRGHVRKPDEVARGDLPGGAVYCGTIPPRPGRDGCPPLQDAAVLDPFGHRVPAAVVPPLVVTELPQRRAFRCRDYAEIIARVSTARHRDGGRSYTLSAPMRELLLQAAGNDPAFAAEAARARAVVDL